VKNRIEDILKQVRDGVLTPEAALEELKDFPCRDLGFAQIDHHRELRKGHPEIIYGLGKTPDQIMKISAEILEKGSNLLVTKVKPETWNIIREGIPGSVYNELGRTVSLMTSPPPPGKGRIAVITAGTSDIPIAEEACATSEILGNETERIYDVGVAGLHRILGQYERIRKARVLIVVAGMEGALPSVVAGLTAVPIVAVPTSVGYGASFGGLAALLAMLNSCPGGVGVVNIDNGFGAAYLASLINHL
jgi:pyridinium-3,5-biscarboxylic acid mononucleotide synthase